MRWLSLLHIRVQLTAWNILVFGGILVLYASGTSWFFLSTLNRQLDGSLKEELELIEQLLPRDPEGTIARDVHGKNIEQLERFMEVWSADGRLLYRSKTLGGRELGGAPDTSLLPGVRIRSHLLTDGTRLRVAEKLSTLGGSPTVVRLGVDEEGYFSDLQSLLAVLFIATPVALVLVSLSAYAMAHRALKPIDIMASTATRIGAKDLKERIPVKHPDDELGRLAVAFNELLSRVQKAFEQLRRFTADASHELRTPLTAMRSVGEVGLRVERSVEQYREVIGSMLEETNRLTKLVDSLLFLTNADMGKHELHFERIDLATLVNDTVGILAVLAEEKRQELSVNTTPGVSISADAALLRQALLNLIDNAIKFAPAGGTIAISTGVTEDQRCFIDVTDSGPRIPEAEQERIFERFYRIDRRSGTGAGLGLAIARWAAEANGGTLTLDVANEQGCTFRILLPRDGTPP